MSDTLTALQKKALHIFYRKAENAGTKEGAGMRPREFARAMWPDSPGWDRYTRCGPKGVTRGGGMNLAAGAYMGKLFKAGYLDYDGYLCGYRINQKGREALKDA